MLICMCMLNKRTHILFDETLWKRLVYLAKRSNTSVGNLIRIAVEEHYNQKNTIEKIKQTCESIETHRKRFKGAIDYKQLINYGRKH